LTNDRLICSLTGFSKMFELFIYCKLNKHLQIHNIFVTGQYGFRKGLSTIIAIYKLAETILNARKTYIFGVFCELTKASV
jgi:hypothetical protein